MFLEVRKVEERLTQRVDYEVNNRLGRVVQVGKISDNYCRGINHDQKLSQLTSLVLGHTREENQGELSDRNRRCLVFVFK